MEIGRRRTKNKKMSNTQQSLALGSNVGNLLQRHELFKIMQNSHPSALDG
jgi:hypothetical protein